MLKQGLLTHHSRERGGGLFRKTLIVLSLFLILIIKVSYAAAPIAGFGTALDFDGKDDYVALSDGKVSAESLGLSTQEITVEAWIKTDEFEQKTVFIGFFQDNSDFERGWQFRSWPPNKFDFGLKSESMSQMKHIRTGGYKTGKWYHLAGTYDGQTMKFYINGIEVGAEASSGDIHYADSWYRIGSYTDDTRHQSADAQIDEVRVWNIARNQADIQSTMYQTLQGNETGLVSYYSFDEGSGMTALDKTGHHHGTLTAMDNKNWVDNTSITFIMDNTLSLNSTLPSSDADGDALSYHIIDHPRQGKLTLLNISTGAFIYTPNTGKNATDSFTYQVNDGKIDSNIATAFVELYNNAPTLSGTPITQIDVNQAYHFKPTADDEDGHPLTFSIINQPSWARFNTQTGELTGTPPSSEEGHIYPIEIQVTDGADAASLAFSLIVGTVIPLPDFGQALDFNGIDQYLTCGHDDSLRPTDAITVEAWVKSESVDGLESPLSLIQDTLEYESGYALAYRYDKMHFFLKTTNMGDNELFYNPGAIIKTSAWHHIAATYDGATIKFYLNGVLQEQRTQTGSINWEYVVPTHNFRIGKYFDYDEHYYFDGQIDEVRIWNVARTHAQIVNHLYKTLQGNEDGLVAYYSFEEGSGSTAHDQTANKNHCQLVNMDENNWGHFSNYFSTPVNTSFNGKLFGRFLTGIPLTYRLVSKPDKGIVTLHDASTGAFIYTPTPGQIGIDSFTYEVSDNTGTSKTATVTVNINPQTTYHTTNPYSNKMKASYEYGKNLLTIPGASFLIVSVFGETELDNDFIEFRDGKGHQLEPIKMFSGIINETFTVKGDSIRVGLESDNQIVKKGVTVTIDNKPLVSTINKTGNKNTAVNFSLTDFNASFLSASGVDLSHIKITTLPERGRLQLGSTPLRLNQAIKSTEINQLKYIPASDYTGLVRFNWQGHDGIAYSRNDAEVLVLVQPFVYFNGTLMDLESAIIEANRNRLPNTITFNEDITLTQRLPILTGDIELIGNGHTISGKSQYQVFLVNGGTVKFSNLRIADGLAKGGNGGNGANHEGQGGSGGGGGGGAGLGGALFINSDSVVNVTNVTFINNQATGGKGGNSGSYDGLDGLDGQNGFNRITVQEAFGSGGGGGGGSFYGEGGLGGDAQSKGKGGNGNVGGDGKDGNHGQNLGVGGGGGGSCWQNLGGAGGNGGFGAGGGGGGSNIIGVGAEGGVSPDNLGGHGGLDLQGGAGGGGGAGLGGALFVRSGATLTINSSRFKNNSATGGEGGKGDNQNNHGKAGTNKGGAVFIQDGAMVALEGTLTFINNQASGAEMTESDNADIYGTMIPVVTLKVEGKLAEQDSTPAILTLSRPLGFEGNTLIGFTISGTAKPEEDYTVSGAASFDGTNGFVLISGNNDSVTLTITPVDDEVVDPDETTLQFNLEDGDDYQLNKAAKSATMLIDENDYEQAFTGVYLETGSSTILNEEQLNIAGKLSRFPEKAGENLSGIEVLLTISAPDGTQKTLTGETHTDTGQFEFAELSLPGLFNPMQEGVYGFQVHFGGSEQLAEAQSNQEAVLVGASAGYAIVIQGKIPNEEGLASHNKTLNRVYNKLLARGLEALNIHYFNYDITQDGVDAVPTKEAIATAFSDMQGRMNSNPAPLYVVMVDHGSRDGSFHIYKGPVEDEEDVIKPNDLASWLENLEAGLGSHALQKPRVMMMGFCFSGAYIPALSKPGRIIITSAAADEESFKGMKEPDGIRSGEFFIEEFFQQLNQGENLKKAFELATAKTENYTTRGERYFNSNNRFLDDALQHPLLDDNGDGEGSNALSATGDGLLAKGILLGAGLDYETNAPSNPATILRTNPTVYLGASQHRAPLKIHVNNANRVNAAPVDIRLPSVKLRASGKAENTEQLEIKNLPRVFMDCTQATHTCRTQFDQFIEPGKYEAFYFVRDNENNDISPVKRSLIYKNYAENSAPKGFNLKFPNAEGLTATGTQPKTTLLLDWGNSSDLDGLVTYNVIVASDSEFHNVLYQQEELTTATTYIDERVALADQKTYYWKVEAVDPFGARTRSNAVYSFTTNNTNAPLSVVSLSVFSDVTYTPLEEVQFEFFKTDDFGNLVETQAEIYQNQGRYQVLLP